MIETKRTVTTVDGKQIVLEPGCQQVIQCDLAFKFVDGTTGGTGFSFCEKVVHLTREPLELAGLIPDVLTHGKRLPPITTESLIVQLLEHLGVKFEE